jgi:hypothetical protein
VFSTRWEPRSSRAISTAASTPGVLKAGVRRFRVHDTRHSSGSLLAVLDVHPRVAMQILRHSKISITMEIYTEVPRCQHTRGAQSVGRAARMNGDCCTSVLYVPGETAISRSQCGLTWVELRGLEPLTPACKAWSRCPASSMAWREVLPRV